MKFKTQSGEGAADSKNYLRLKDKDSVTGLLVGDPYEFQAHWNGKATDKCPEDNSCPHCAAGLKSKFRFRANFIIKEGSGYVSKVLEQGWGMKLDIETLSNQGYSLENHLVTISRAGSGLHDTKYSILPTRNGELKPEQLRNILSTPLQVLEHKEESKPQGKGSGSIDPNYEATPAFDDSDEIPF